MDKEHLHRQWMERIAQYRNSGLTMKAWCEQHGIKMDQLKYWLYKRKRPTHETGAQAGNRSPWIPLQVDESPSDNTSSIRISIGSACIDIRPGFEPSLLVDVVKVLKALC